MWGPAAAVIRGRQALSGFIGRKECAGGLHAQVCPDSNLLLSRIKSHVKFQSSTLELHEILADLREGEVDGTHGVGVKSVDIVGNTKGEGNQLALS